MGRLSTGVWLVPAYLALLLVSHGIRYFQPDPWSAPPGFSSVSLAAGNGKPVEIRYRDSAPGNPDQQPVILIIHGSPAPASRVMAGLWNDLAGVGRVICPDLPGFGYSTRDLPDYGAASHARALKGLLDRLEINRVHILAYSMGGGAAIHLAAAHPNLVASLNLVAAIGVQELELLGDYHLNHGLHGLQLAGIWAVQELVPHMGLMDRALFNTRYARNFFDTDQRPLRGLILQIRAPTLILHGTEDAFVPPAAALEHHRLIPQSRLAMMPGGHLQIFQDTGMISTKVLAFIQAVEAGRGVTRSGAAPERATAAADPFGNIRVPQVSGLSLFVLALLIALATLVSEDLACIGAGMLAARGIMGFFPATLAAFAGIFIGDLLLFAAGRIIGRPAVTHRPLSWWISADDMDRARQWFDTRGGRIIFTSRFLPGSRLPVYFTAGTIGGSLGSFLFYFLAASAIWTPGLVGLAMLAGEGLIHYYEAFHARAIWVVMGTILVLWLGVKLLVPLCSFRGRRLALARYKRMRHWEFWPIWLMYWPIALYVFWLGLRKGCFTLFTAANPAMPGSGIVGESKSDILAGLAGSGAVAKFVLVKQDWHVVRQLIAVRQFMAAQNVDFPLVCKPDAGERGTGVEPVYDAAGLTAYLETAGSDTIVQQYVDGHEYGVFYYRYPGRENGRILAVTDKHLISVTGDGRSTLEQLILDDPRAVCKAELHLDVHRDRLHQVPEKDETVQLVGVGAHARGALFLDGCHLITPEMEAGFDRVSKAYKGFYFGRYDVKVTSLAAFQRGEGFSVLELNGVTSEATAIYDPANSLMHGWRTLMHQWRIAVEIGEINVKSGAKPLSVWELLSLVFRG